MSHYFYRFIVAVTVGAGMFSSNFVDAQLLRESPTEVQGAKFSNKLGNQLPLETTFVDSQGRTQQLSRFFYQKKPVILAFYYTSCPMLCHLQLEGLVDSLSKIDKTVGVDFDVIAISMDPREKPATAAKTRQRHVENYGRGNVGGWTFLTGKKSAIDQVASAAGFGYQFIPERKEFAHSAGVIVCTSRGVIAEYLMGVMFPSNELESALRQAGEGDVQSAFEQLLMYCFHYDETSGKYTVHAFRLMQVAGMTTLVLLILGTVPFWLRKSLRSHG